jgi:hypothetical protein
MRLRGIIVMVVLLLGVVVHAQELSTSVFLSEDELDEALRNGELTYEQYQNLKEIMQYGIDSVSQYLLDEIPNLMYLLDTDTTLSDLTEQDQTAGFVPRSRATRSRGSVSWRYTTLLEEDTRSWYRSAIDLAPTDHWRFRMHVNREASGVERVTTRSLGFRSRDGLVRRMEFGNFTTRFGLGTVFGHRGKVLDYSEKLDGESFLFPDYGGYNGVLANLQIDEFALHALGSVNRDERHRIFSGGLFVQRRCGPFHPGVIIGVNRITDRTSDVSVTIPTAALTSQMKYRRGIMTLELSRQAAHASSAISGAVEGRHRFESAELRYAGWYYGDDFIDLTSGSKSGQIYIPDSLESVGFEYRTRRTGQSGGMVRTQVELAERLSCIGSLLHADAGGDRRQQFSGGLIHILNPDWRLQLTYLGKWQRRPTETPLSESDHLWRLESRYNAAPFYVRCYIGYETDYDGHQYGSLFVSARYETCTGERYQIWSNMGEIGEDGIVYWYLFGRGEWSLGKRVITAAKLSNSYRRDGEDQNSTQFSVELTVNL